MPRLVVAGLFCGLSACSNLRSETIAIDYKPASTPVAVVPGAEKVSVSVLAADKRVQRTDHIATKQGIFEAQVTASNDVVEVVRGAVEQGLRSQGFVIADGGLVVMVEVQNFYNDYQPDGLTNTTSADTAFTLRVKNTAGATLYSRFYEGSGKTDYFIDATADKAKSSLEKALANTVGLVTADKALDAALLLGGGVK